MFPRQRGDDHVEFFQGHDPISRPGPGYMTYKIQEKLNRRIVGEGENFGEHITRPIFVEHLFFSDQDYVAAQRRAFAHKVAAFKKGGDADDVELLRLRR
jgi:hypothetical protein